MNWNNILTFLFFLAKLTRVTFKGTFMFLGGSLGIAELI